jgi:hypothetical protein
MPDYKKGKIYTIRCSEDPALIYVGSTIQLLSQRWTDHKKTAQNDKNKGYNIYFYQVMREKGLDNFFIELHDEYPCENKEQLTKQEGKVIREIGTLNSRIEGRTWQEYYHDNKEHKVKLHKEWYNNNKERVLERVKDYSKQNKEKLNLYRKSCVLCDCGASVSYTHKSRHEKTKKHLELMEAKTSQQDTE